MGGTGPREYCVPAGAARPRRSWRCEVPTGACLVKIGTVVCLVLLGAACAAGGAATTTVNPDSGLPTEEAAADLGPGVRLELQARAMARAWSEWASGRTPVCARAEAPAELRAAIAEVFPVEVEYLDAEDPELAPGGEYRCVW